MLTWSCLLLLWGLVPAAAPGQVSPEGLGGSADVGVAVPKLPGAHVAVLLPLSPPAHPRAGPAANPSPFV